MKFLKSVVFMLSILSLGFLEAADIHDAAKAGNLRKVKALIDKNPELIDIQDKDNHLKTALHVAVEKKRADVVEFLLGRGANPNLGCTSTDIDIFLPVLQKGITPLHISIAMGNEAITRMLLEQNADPFLRTSVEFLIYSNTTEDTPLCRAVLADKQNLVELIILTRAKDNRKSVAQAVLRFAASVEMVKLCEKYAVDLA